VRSRRSTSLVIVGLLGLVAAGCSRVPPGGEAAGGLGRVSAGGGDALSPDGTQLQTDGGGTGGAGAAPGGASAGGSGTGRAGGGGGGSAGSGPSAAGALRGVDVANRTISVVFPIKDHDCGPDNNTAKQGTATAKGKQVVQTYVDFFNKEVLAPVNWKLKYQFVDDGGLYCPENARAAAVKIVKEIKPFAVLGGEVSIDAGPVVQDAVTKAGIIHIGRSFATYDEFQKRHPYEWDATAVPQKLYEYLGDWMSKRVKGTKFTDATTGLQSDRKYGLLAVDKPEIHKMAGFMKGLLAGQGIDLSNMYFINPDPSVAAQAAATTVQKIQSDGVNSLIFDMNSTVNAGQAGVVYTSAMDSQNYLPDLLTMANGNAFFERLFDSRVWARARGTSVYPIVALRLGVRANPQTGALESDPRYENINENSAGYDDVWKRSGHNDLAQDGSVPGGYDTWVSLTLLAQGLLHAGPNLTVESWAAGVQSTSVGQASRCSTWRFMGRDYKHNAFYNWDAKHDGGLEGYTSIYWVNKQTPLGTNGFYESYDDYQYFRGLDDLPAQPVHDTGQDADYTPVKQQPIGLHPWVRCSSLGQRD
jgi:hypothetical protein